MPLKRSSPARKPSALTRSPLRTRRKPRPVEPGREAWKAPHAGYCECCGINVPHLERHHVVTERHVRQAGGDPWDLRNSILLAPRCHANHHSRMRPIPLPLVPDAAIAFACELYGSDEAGMGYLLKRYAPELP
jgi:5-methylcytosine-specific restriction endonuclease McrA